MSCSCVFCCSSGWIADAVRLYESGIYPGTPPYERRKIEIAFWSRRWARRARGED